jgi:hypothetical protein
MIMRRRIAATAVVLLCAAALGSGGFAGAAGATGAAGTSGSWAVQVTPNPSGALGSHLLGESCPPSSGVCTAVGYYKVSASLYETLAESWDGTSWAIPATPNPTGATNSALAGVSCPSADACTAVGESSNGSAQTTLAESWDGTSWTISSTPDVTGATLSELSGVSCPTTSACTAVGNYVNSSSAQVTVAESWNGTSWTIQSTPNPAGAATSELLGVSCPSSSVCTAVGDSFTASVETTLAESWNGTTWTIQSTPSPSGVAYSPLLAVSCPSVSACTAVGDSGDSSSTDVTLAESWNGTSWTMPSTPNPAGATTSALAGVSCSSTSACSAVGDSESNAVFGTLAEYFAAPAPPPPPAPQGFWLASADGAVFNAGAAPDLPGTHVPSSDPVVGIAATADGEGYWLVTADGTVIAEGDAESLGSHGSLPGLGVHVSDIVAIAPTGDGEGYWLIGRDGGEFAFGNAQYHGSLPGLGVHVDDIVGMVATSDGGGYWIVGSDGGVFAFGDTHYVGSLPGLGIHVNDIRAMIPSPTREGYVLVGSDGGAFVFGGGVHYYGSLPGEHIAVSDIVGLALTPDTLGYWFAGSNGVAYQFGDAKNLQVSSAVNANLPVVAIAAS